MAGVRRAPPRVMEMNATHFAVERCHAVCGRGEVRRAGFGSRLEAAVVLLRKGVLCPWLISIASLHGV